MAEQQLFARRTAIVLSLVVSITLAVTIVAALLAQPGEAGPGHAANSFSVSAIGFHALVELLGKAGLPAVASEHVSGQRSAPSRPLLLLAPAAEEQALATMLTHAEHRAAPVIVVLPKWRGRASPRNRRWITRLRWRPVQEPASVLRQVLGGTSGPPLVRSAQSDLGWRAAVPMAGPPMLPAPQLLARGATTLEPLVWHPDGILAAVDRARQLLVISDPDLLANAGLGAGDNAALALELLLRTFPGTTALVVDETLHGFTRAPSLWRELLRFPLVLVTAQLGLLLLAVVWTAFDRFGRVLAPGPRVAPGTQALIESTTGLITRGASVSYTLHAYWRLIIRRTARRLGIGPGPGSAAPLLRQARRLAAAGANRGLEQNLAWLTEQIQQIGDGRCEPRRAVRLARHLWHWRKEMLDGAR